MSDAKKCRQPIEGGANHPIVRCDKPAKRLVKGAGVSLYGEDMDNMPVCGTHGNFWKNRGFTVIPIIEIKP